MKRCFVVESDCLGIVERLKEVDKDYFLVFDLDAQKFQLHNRSQKGETYCLTFPFEKIDERMVDFARKTRVQNSDALFEEIEKENKLQMQKALSTTTNAFKEKLYDLCK